MWCCAPRLLLQLWSLPDLAHVTTVTKLHAAATSIDALVDSSRGKLHGGHPAPWGARAGGVSSVTLTEDYVVTTGFDGAVYAVHQLW